MCVIVQRRPCLREKLSVRERVSGSGVITEGPCAGPCVPVSVSVACQPTCTIFCAVLYVLRCAVYIS